MPFGLPSELAGPAFLSVLLMVALLIAARRERPDAARVLPAACLALGVQALHVAEEFSTGFHVRAPRLFGLDPWSPSFFVWINLAAIAAWCLALAALAGGRANAFSIGLLWFLAIASVGNAFWHPAASLLIGGYFPGTVTALPLGATGVVLIRALVGSSRPLTRRPAPDPSRGG
jgi:hypothetical protein